MKRILIFTLLLGASNSNAQNLQVQNLTVTGTTTLATPAAAAGNCSNILAYGGSGNGTNDNSTAFANAIAALPTGHACVYFPPGNFYFSTAAAYTFSTSISSFTLTGAGSDQTQLTWGGNGGLTVNFAGSFNSVHIRDISLTTSAANPGAAITLNQTGASIPNPANSAVSDITGVTVRGADGYAVNDYWAYGVNVAGVSNVNFLNDTFVGKAAIAGVGVYVHGTSTLPPVVFNFTNSFFQWLGIGIEYGNYVQGVTVSQSNFTADSYGIYTQQSLSGLDQLVVSSSQFNCSAFGILEQSSIANTMIQNNLFIVPNNAIGIDFESSFIFSILGNTFNANGSASNSNGVVISSVTGAGGTVTGNTFYNLTTGVYLQSSSTKTNVQSNSYAGNANTVVNSGTNNTVGGGSP